MQRRYILMLFVLIVLGLGLGYASLSTNLNITGTTTLKDNRWNIHLENVQVTTGSVSATTPTINTNKDTVTYSITLNKLGDFYEFTVDCKNDGSINGMISNISSKLNGEELTTLPNALSYSLTYSDGVEIANKHLLKAGEKVTYKLRVEYRTDINISDIPSTEQTLNFSFTITYAQADNTAVEKPKPTTGNFTIAATTNHYGSPIPSSVTIYNDYNEAIAAFRHPFFLKHDLDNNNNIEYSYVGFVLNDNAFFLQGAGATENSDMPSGYNNDSIYYDNNKATALSAFGSSKCTDYNTYISCKDSNVEAIINKNGYIDVTSESWGCIINSDGDSSCDYYI